MHWPRLPEGLREVKGDDEEPLGLTLPGRSIGGEQGEKARWVGRCT